MNKLPILAAVPAILIIAVLDISNWVKLTITAVLLLATWGYWEHRIWQSSQQEPTRPLREIWNLDEAELTVPELFMKADYCEELAAGLAEDDPRADQLLQSADSLRDMASLQLAMLPIVSELKNQNSVTGP